MHSPHMRGGPGGRGGPGHGGPQGGPQAWKYDTRALKYDVVSLKQWIIDQPQEYVGPAQQAPRGGRRNLRVVRARLACRTLRLR